jgi:hypothetical protein
VASVMTIFACHSGTGSDEMVIGVTKEAHACLVKRQTSQAEVPSFTTQATRPITGGGRALFVRVIHPMADTA